MRRRGVIGLAVAALIAIGTAPSTHAAGEIRPTSDAKAMLGLKLRQGVPVMSVRSGSDAARAGVQSGDLIWAVNGEEVSTAVDLQFAVGQHLPGSAIELDVWRNGKAITLTLALTPPSSLPPQDEQRFLLGIEPCACVFVEDVVSGTPAVAAGLAPGDLLTEVDGVAVDTMTRVVEIVREHAPGDTIRVAFLRGGARMEVTATLAPVDD